jgi:hypothetical protein
MNIHSSYQKFILLKDESIDIENYKKEWNIFLKDQLDTKGRGAYGYSKKLFTRFKIIEKNKNEYNEFREYIYELYHIQEYGLKSIAKELGISYTSVRGLFSILSIDFKKGRSVVSNRLKKIRRDNAIKSHGWRDKRTKTINTERGVQGYFFNEIKNKYVWLRSCYEYIFAKWLNENKIDWDVEIELFKVSEQESYRPDFFLYENNNVSSIVEIKGYYKNRLWKVEKLKKLLKEKKVEVILIDNIKPYIINSTYQKELKWWKINRLLQLE